MEKVPQPNPQEVPQPTPGWVRDAAGEWVSAAPVEVAPQTEAPAQTAKFGEWVQTGNGWVRFPETTEVTQQAAQAPEQEKTQHDANRELLASSEGAVLLLAAYDAAVEAEPRLADILVVPYDESERGAKGSAFARGADISESGKHEIHVRLDDLDASLELMQETLNKVPGLREMMAEKLMIDDPTELTPMQLHTFVMLHEMGHLVEFMDHEGSMPELRKRQRAEKDALPMGNIATSDLIDPNSPAGKYVRENWETISAEHGVATITELAELKNAAHRSMTSEAFADNFAARVLVYEPTLLEQLGTNDLDRYRQLEAA